MLSNNREEITAKIEFNKQGNNWFYYRGINNILLGVLVYIFFPSLAINRDCGRFNGIPFKWESVYTKI